MTGTATATAAEAVLAAVHDLAPAIGRRAARIERARRLPADLLDELHRAGCFRMLRPPGHGGLGVAVPEAMRVYEALAAADASVGWTVMIGSAAWCDLVGLPRAAFDALFAGRPDAVVGGTINPCGRAERVEGGYRVSGRWPFASGCEHSDWLFGNCVEEVGDEQRMRIVVLAPGDVTIQDTWTVSGLAGTGSHHFRAEEVLVPAERSFDLFTAEPCLDEPIARIPPPALPALCIASTALGVAGGALAEIRDVATGKVPLLASAALAANPLFQYQLATADTDLRAARALLHAEAADAWTTASARAPLTLDQRARIRSAAVWATTRAAAVVDFAYHAGGGGALYATSPLQRRLRDVHAITQHFVVRPDTMTTAGAVLAGQEITAPIF
ncbi:acyl-CoA dehydrogenase family protein [Pseudonocardia lacus]|uniref:acyl-CoA dehydrogenase family protein n=1 Tax=Pseudonocardia lacus TaxID=2835865 RepID=UPI001BDD80ED|nr:acyl-CoA dehydrogenase family protein [Pseudonocardia lacus]